MFYKLYGDIFRDLGNRFLLPNPLPQAGGGAIKESA
jgi:hypothetical protein